jgi:two-component sensor histidine kinase/CHASE3 domain sensor protein
MSMSGRLVVQSAIGLLAVGFLALLGIIGMTSWLGERSQVYFRDVIEARDTRSAAVELRTALQTAESAQRGFLFTSNQIYLAPYDSQKVMALRQLETLAKALAPYPETNVMVRRLTELVTEKFAEMDETIKLKNALRDADALAVVRTNRGKAVMDEANVFLAGIIRGTDERLTMGVGEQRANAAMLRWASIGGGLVIVLVVAAVILTVTRYTREVRHARDEVRQLNAGLEERVKQRTSDLARARDRAELLLAEVNHRVANSLSLVASLVKLQSNAVRDKAAKDALAETQARIDAIASVHKRLYASGDVRSVALDEYLTSLLEQLQTSMRDEGLGGSLTYDLEPIELPTDASINLAVVVTEWVTNAFKYAYPGRGGEVRVRLKRLAEGRAELAVEDDGVGRGDGIATGTGLGTRIVRAMAQTMGAEIQYLTRTPGTEARLIFPFQTA